VILTVALLVAVFATLAGYAAFTWLSYRRARDILVPVMLALTAYWTLIGAIPVLLAKAAHPAGTYSYLEGRLFPLFADGTYAEVLLCYAIFLMGTVLLTVVLARARSRREVDDAHRQWKSTGASVSHVALLATIGALYLIKLVVFALVVRSAGASSLYEVTRVASSRLIVVYQYLNVLTSYPAACGAGLWLAFGRSAPTSTAARRSIGAGYCGLVIAVVVENAVLGNRAVPLLCLGAIAVAWVRWRYLPATRSARRALRVRFALTAFVGLLAVGAIGITRGGSLTNRPSAIAAALASSSLRAGDVVASEVSSSEKLAAHMSLYGILRLDDVRYSPLAGSSYERYSELVSAPPDQVFTVHYVTSWWLRVGPVGVLVATASFGLLLALVQRLGATRPDTFRAPFALAASTLTAVGLPVTLLRSGPEAIRAVVLELVILPGLVLLPAFVLGRRGRRVEVAA